MSELKDEMIALLYDCVEHYSEKEGVESIYAKDTINRFSDLTKQNPARKAIDGLCSVAMKF